MKVCDYQVWVSLGCSKEEQQTRQPVLFNIEIHFANKVLGEKTDRLEDAIDYVQLTEIIQKTAQLKSYSLIENMCFEVMTALALSLKKKNVSGELQVDLLKIRAPIKNLKTGVNWSCRQIL